MILLFCKSIEWATVSKIKKKTANLNESIESVSISKTDDSVLWKRWNAVKKEEDNEFQRNIKVLNLPSTLTNPPKFMFCKKIPKIRVCDD